MIMIIIYWSNKLFHFWKYLLSAKYCCIRCLSL